MSPQDDVNRLVKLARPTKPGQLIFALDSSFVAANPGRSANRAQGRSRTAKCKKGAAISHALSKHVNAGKYQAASDFTRADRRDILRASVFL